MSLRRFVPLALPLLALVALLTTISLLSFDRTARALPPGGTDLLNATAQVGITSRLGSETINFTGTATILRQDPHMDGSVEVADAEIVGLSLSGQSLTGTVNVSESASRASTGEIRSLQPQAQFPASSFFDVFIEASVPASPQPTLMLHNEAPLSVIASPNLSAWPPVGVTYQGQFDPSVPLLNPQGSTLPADIRVTSVSITLGAPKTPPSPSSTLPPTATGTVVPTATLPPGTSD